MGSLADRLDAMPRSLGGQGRRGSCAVATILAALDDDDRAALDDALAAVPGPTARSVADSLAAEGWAISAETVSKHRRGGCACARSAG